MTRRLLYAAIVASFAALGLFAFAMSLLRGNDDALSDDNGGEA